jgi:hypothetical protein
MVILKVWAALFALLVLVKLVMLVVARDYWLGLAEKLVRPGNRVALIYGAAAAVVGLPVLLQVSIIEIGAVMLWTSLLMGLSLAPYGEMVLKWRDEITRVGLAKIWWVLAIWAGLAVWMLVAVFGG